MESTFVQIKKEEVSRDLNGNKTNRPGTYPKGLEKYQAEQRFRAFLSTAHSTI